MKIIKYAYAFSKLAERRAAGFLFICPADRTVFLVRRSRHVSQPRTWGLPGGGIEMGESFRQGAEREVHEEMGSMPKIERVQRTLKTDNYEGVTYVTFVAEVSLEEKNRWKPRLNWESESYEWFSKLPDDVHPGLAEALENLS